MRSRSRCSSAATSATTTSPRCPLQAPMSAVIHEMTDKGLGMPTVTHPDGRLAGILTDGDLRRLMEKHRGATLEMTAGEAMTRNPTTTTPHAPAREARAGLE